MKHVFEFRGTPQTTCSGRTYAQRCDEKPEAWPGAFVELLAVDVLYPDTQFHREGDALYLEGDIKSVRAVLQDALAMLESFETVERERFEEDKQHFSRCGKCETWTDRRLEEHADGNGSLCPGARLP